MSILISGGAKNGKSMYAQKKAKEIADRRKSKLYYFATMKPKDEEDEKRIQRHLKERENWGFVTIEEFTSPLQRLKDIDEKGVVLFDSITALLENVIFDENFEIRFDEVKRILKELEEFSKKREVLFVTDNIYCDGMIYDETTEIYRKSLANIDRRLAEVCDRVIEIVCNNEIEYRSIK